MPKIASDQMMTEEEPGSGDGGGILNAWISEPGGLTQFGAVIQTMPPGARSSDKHWHAHEDEMVFVLDGEATLHEGDAVTTLRAGDAATFKAGEPVGHCIENRTASPLRLLVVGTRAPVDRITYTDRDLVCHRDRSLPDDTYTDRAGNPLADPFTSCP